MAEDGPAAPPAADAGPDIAARDALAEAARRVLSDGGASGAGQRIDTASPLLNECARRIDTERARQRDRDLQGVIAVLARKAADADAADRGEPAQRADAAVAESAAQHSAAAEMAAEDSAAAGAPPAASRGLASIAGSSPVGRAREAEVQAGPYGEHSLWQHPRRWWRVLLIVLHAVLKLFLDKFASFATDALPDGRGDLLGLLDQGDLPDDLQAILGKHLDKLGLGQLALPGDDKRNEGQFSLFKRRARLAAFAFAAWLLGPKLCVQNGIFKELALDPRVAAAFCKDAFAVRVMPFTTGAYWPHASHSTAFGTMHWQRTTWAPLKCSTHAGGLQEGGQQAVAAGRAVQEAGGLRRRRHCA
jgi:hypothetical protein